MDGIHMVLLEKIVPDRFPVGLQQYRLVLGKQHVLKMIGRQIVEDGAEKMLQRRRIRLRDGRILPPNP